MSSRPKSASARRGALKATNTTRVVAPFWETSGKTAPVILNQDIVCDTAIIGGGIAGLATALTLSDQGHRPVVLEAGFTGEGSTGYCGGILSTSTTIDLHLVEAAFGLADSRRLFKALSDVLAACRQRFGNCDWQTGKSLYVAAKAPHRKILAEELESKKHYDMNMSLVGRKELDGDWKGFFGGLSTEGEHAVHPVKLVDGITEQLAARGVRLYQRSPVQRWRHNGKEFEIEVNGKLVRSRDLVLACGLAGTPKGSRRRSSGTLIPAQGYIAVTEPSPEVLELSRRTGVIELWDTLHLYHYARYLPDGRMLVGGEEALGAIPSEALGAGNNHVKNLSRWAQSHHRFKLPPVQFAWRASLVIPADGLPLLETQDFGPGKLVNLITDGLPFAMLLGEAATDILSGKQSWLHELLGKRRPKPLSAQMLNVVPESPLVRQPLLKAAFLALKLYDSIL